MLCLLCNKEFERLSHHLLYTHKISPKEYYDIYLKKENEEICPICGKENTFIKLTKGYQKFCSDECFKSKEASILIHPKKNIIKNKKSKEEIYQKRKQTCLDKYGVENVFQSNEIKNKIKEKWIENYNTDNPSKANIIKEKQKQKKLNNLDYLKFISELKNKNFVPLFTEKEFYSLNNEIKFKCDKCNNINITDSRNIQLIRCKCKSRFTSLAEDEIEQFLNSFNIKTERNIKRKYEIDIFLPEYNVGIDYHGIYWHSEINVDKNYHKNKFLYFNDIKFIQIFQNEWTNKKEIVQSLILSKIGKFQNRFYARKCKVRELSNKEYREFLNQNHIQGYSSAKYKVGLFYNESLVTLMSFGQSRFKKDEVELIRYCNLLNTQVVGAFSKLLKYAIENYKFEEIISYCDLRYFNGEGYLKNGFILETHTNPNYFYWHKSDSLSLYNRINFQKHKLKNLLENFDENLTEYHNMLNNGYNRIWDCGNLKLRYKKG